MKALIKSLSTAWRHSKDGLWPPFQLAHSRYAGLICDAARMLRCVGCIQKFTNLLPTFRISSLHPARGYLTPIGVDEPKANLQLSRPSDCLNSRIVEKWVLKKNRRPDMHNNRNPGKVQRLLAKPMHISEKVRQHNV